MFRKTISIALCIILLLCMSVPAFATPNESEQTESKTVEEILNEYHEKAYQTRLAEDANDPAVYSRQAGGNSKTLEEETVDELTSAGYEAYNVTSENYDDLEAALKTDFAELGLDPNGSYIVVLSKENHSNQTHPNSRSGLPPEESLEGGDGGSSYFGYQYNGSIYYLRHIIFTATTGSYMIKQSLTRLYGDRAHDAAVNLVDTSLSAIADYCTGKFKIGTLLSMLGVSVESENYTLLEDDELTCHANTTWVANCIQVWDNVEEIWETRQCSAYANSQAYFTGFLFNENTGLSERFDGETYSQRINSPNYYSYSQRYDNAVTYYLNGRISYDYTGDIEFFLTDKDDEIVYTSSNRPLFTHVEEWEVPSYSQP